ncbi:hypothetical protein FA95DRAFT_1562736 [Auriscalpium vulgare]|uniref:Uncharacterized protein n=1 Tax=Auriscalpium vulgare TaxID=40419 RepID=A0ACB8RIN0_9AGAM|nr:hypothetical protein FA95DRAFT_1562736 [Auriscalpium vulgare]
MRVHKLLEGPLPHPHGAAYPQLDSCRPVEGELVATRVQRGPKLWAHDIDKQSSRHTGWWHHALREIWDRDDVSTLTGGDS